MTDEKLQTITRLVADTIENSRNTMLCGDLDKQMEIIDVLASVHNELYREVTGGYYDYMFHWANLGYGGCPDDSLFKEEQEGKKDD